MTARPLVPFLMSVATLAASFPSRASVEAPRSTSQPIRSSLPNQPHLRPKPLGKQHVLTERQIPTTAAEHEALARTYEENAFTYQQVALVQHDLLAVMKASPLESTAEGRRNLERMEKHSREMIKDADRLAANARKAAQRQHELAQQPDGE